MATTSYRSVLMMRKLGYRAENVEKRIFNIRRDLMGCFDCIAFKAGEPAILIQAFHKKETEKHKHLNAEHPIIKAWLSSGNKFEWHIWQFITKKGRKYWSVERVDIK